MRAAIARDKADGFLPACVIATAGTVNTGAIDDLPALAALPAEEDLWLHVDGCIGALIAIAPKNAWRVAGIEKADFGRARSTQVAACAVRGRLRGGERRGRP